jgi:hypothetical protein
MERGTMAHTTHHVHAVESIIADMHSRLSKRGVDECEAYVDPFLKVGKERSEG